jgi:methylenetetrahydrofolate reductase (NADPH)
LRLATQQDVIQDYPTLSFHALNLEGKEYRNTPKGSVTAVTWGVFPGQEIIQPTVVDSESFEFWKQEAFELWQAQWASAYGPDSSSYNIIQQIYSSYFLVNIVDNDYTSEKSDIFHIFTRIIADNVH